MIKTVNTALSLSLMSVIVAGFISAVPAVAAVEPHPTADQAIARDRLNMYRARAGLLPVKLDAVLDQASKNHANYMWQNNWMSHDEDPHKPGYTAVWPWDRVNNLDSSRQNVCCSEVITAGWGDDTLAGPRASVDSLMASLYHRLVLLDPRIGSIGFGEVAGSNRAFATMDMYEDQPESKWKGHQAQQSSAVSRDSVVWPPDGDTLVPPTWEDHEFPDPLPNGQRIAGTVVTGEWYDWPYGQGSRLTEYSLKDQSGQAVDCYTYSRLNDPQIEHFGVSIIPKAPLKSWTKYMVNIHAVDSSDHAHNLNWSFTTGGTGGAVDPYFTGDELTGGGIEYFPQTGFTAQGLFLSYWQSHGGLAQFGYPISTPLAENGYVVQYFERNRLEYHPEFAGTQYAVELGLLGRDVANDRYGRSAGIFRPAGANGKGQYFATTGHNLSPIFLQYWQAHGGLAQFGYPTTEEFKEVSREDGQTYTVQYFERNRFEYHPEHAGTPYEVQLGLLGHWSAARSPLASASAQ